MSTWSGLGINYGHQLGTYDSSVASSDLDYLKSIGITKLRVAFPDSRSSDSSLQKFKDLIVLALSKQFYVQWGLAIFNGFDQTQWNTYKDHIRYDIAPWAQSVGLSELSMGNEMEGKTSGTPTALTMRSDIRTLGGQITSDGFTGQVSIQLVQTQLPNWISEGITGLTRIGINCYGSRTTYINDATSLKTNFPTTGDITEWGTSNGYADFNDEEKWTQEIVQRQKILKDLGIGRAYYFTYKVTEGVFGLNANKWEMKLTNGDFRTAWNPLSTNNGRRFFMNV